MSGREEEAQNKLAQLQDAKVAADQEVSTLSSTSWYEPKLDSEIKVWFGRDQCCNAATPPLALSGTQKAFHGVVLLCDVGGTNTKLASG